MAKIDVKFMKADKKLAKAIGLNIKNKPAKKTASTGKATKKK